MATTHSTAAFDLPTTAQASLELNTGFLEPNLDKWPREPESASDWFCLMFPDQVRVFGPVFLEERKTDGLGLVTKSPLSTNYDTLAACLGGDERLGHRIIYYVPELQFYFYDPRTQMFHATTEHKLQNLLRGLLSRCAEAMKGDRAKFQLFHSLRSDQVIKAVTNRCKSILAASPNFFSVTSPNQRVVGPELHQRIALVFARQLLEVHEGSILTVGQSFTLFNQFAKARNMAAIKRADFKSLMSEVIRDAYGLGVRNDLMNAETQKQQCGWKGLRAASLA